MIPVTVLTGFLGSGKTTLLSQLVRAPAFARTAVLMNEFGEVGLDHDLIATSNEQFVELTTGCLCCKVQSDLVVTLNNLLDRREAGEVASFERIVIETTGLADPAPILHSLMTTPRLLERVTIAAVITTVDCVTGMRTLEAEPVSRKQVAVADRLILTKTDLAGGIPGELARTIDALNGLAPRFAVVAGAIEAVHLTASSEAIWDIDRVSVERDDDGGGHLDGISSFVLLREAPIPAVALTLFLEALAEHCGEQLLRLKGIVAVAEAPERPAVVHGVQHVFHPLDWLDGWPSADRRTRLVFIGRGLGKAWADALLRAIECEVNDLVGSRAMAGP